MTEKESVEETLIRITKISNLSTYDISFQYKDNNGNWLSCAIAKKQSQDCEILCSAYYVKWTSDSGSEKKLDLWTIDQTKKLWRDNHPERVDVEETKAEQADSKPETTSKEKPKKTASETNLKRFISTEDGIRIFAKAWLNEKKWCSYYSDTAMRADSVEVYSMIDSLKATPSKETIERAKALLEMKRLELKHERMVISENVQRYYIDEYKRNPLEHPQEVKNGILKILEERIETREEDLMRLESLISGVREKKGILNDEYLIAGGVVILLIILILVFALAGRKKKTKSNALESSSKVENGSADSGLVVVRKTTNAVLKTQNIDDVIGNDSYLKIDCNEFSADSAVSTMYLKNSCIIDIYNLYAEDLRNHENPKEDGCMVIGRWIFDKTTQKYIVTLEEIVRLGDDAVFKEYELNFGGKVKVKLAERLRKLRRETELQYDLTCWIHSHPGLGVFFSNSDSNVQMQLKHPTHPLFLTALVVDILTPEQETGIFTFKQEGSINSKNDLKKMYSLETLYKWAVDSEKFGFKKEDYFDILSESPEHGAECSAIYLNNSSIIDISMLVTHDGNGVVGWVQGYPIMRNCNKELVVKGIATSKSSNESELIGCLMMGTHCSIPTIRKTIADHIDSLSFVMFYSTSDEKITVIPIIDHQLCLDENYYGIETLEKLKIWTRRRR